MTLYSLPNSIVLVIVIIVDHYYNKNDELCVVAKL